MVILILVVITNNTTIVFATFSGRKVTVKKQRVQYLKMSVFKHCTLEKSYMTELIRCGYQLPRIPLLTRVRRIHVILVFSLMILEDKHSNLYNVKRHLFLLSLSFLFDEYCNQGKHFECIVELLHLLEYRILAL